MADREVVIKISAKNLTEAEFKKVRKGLAGIGSSGGGANQKISALSRGFTSFGKAAPGALKIVAAAAATTAGAIVGVTAAVIKLGERGAAIADVKSAFDGLSVSAGETGAVMLGALRAGVKGTVSDFALMKIANTALGAGLLSTSADAKTLAEGARLLAKRTGGDTVQAFNTLTTSMASGRTAQLKQLGLFVDNKKAVEDFAEAQGKSVSSLTDTDRAAALQVATMAALRNELESFPAPLADFGELLERGRVGVKNLVDEVAVMISNSPILLEGMRSAGDAISKAFGDDKKGLALGIVNIIEKAALVAVEFGKAGITAADFLLRGFAGVKIMFLGLAAPLTEVGQRLAELVLFTVEVAAKVPGLGNVYGDVVVKARAFADGATAINTSLKQQIVDSVATIAGHGELQQKLQEGKVFLDEFGRGLVNVGLSQGELNAKVKEGGGDMNNLGTAAAGVKAALEEFLPTIDLSRTAIVGMGDDTVIAADLMNTKFGEIVDGQVILRTSFDSTGTTIGGTATAVQAAFSRMGIATRAELQKTADAAKKDYEAILKDGNATADGLKKAFEKSEEAQREARGVTTEGVVSSNENILNGTTTMLSALAGENKAAAMGLAVINTAQAVLQALASGPPPGSWILAAANAAAGAIQIAKIAGVFREGTDRLDFQDFGVSRPAVLHGREAVIPQGGGHRLAQEIAGALGPTRGSSRDADIMEAGFDRLGASLDGLPRSIQRAVRDGMLLEG